MLKQQLSGKKSEEKSTTSDLRKKQESLERLQNQFEQAKLIGDTVRMRMIKSIIDRCKG
jgi:hypothetical protein